MNYAKFMFKIINKMLLDSFDNYFIKLENVYSYNTRQKHRNEYFNPLYNLIAERKTLYYICL